MERLGDGCLNVFCWIIIVVRKILPHDGWIQSGVYFSVKHFFLFVQYFYRVNSHPIPNH